MDIVQTIVLAVLQGLTEFLPISSSAHLILVPVLTGWQDQGLAFDVAVHVGTLLAVLVYFRAQVMDLLVAWFGSLGKLNRIETLDTDARLAWAVLFGTIPVGLAGLAFEDVISTTLRSPLVIAAATLVFGALLGLSDRMRGTRSEREMNWKDVLFIGIAQAVALIPGTSRSGITMTAGLFAGLDRTAAARFSFLLSIPVIVLAGGLETLELLHASEPVAWGSLGLGTLLSFISALACIHYFLKWLPRVGMWPFVLYRLMLGAWLAILFF